MTVGQQDFFSIMGTRKLWYGKGLALESLGTDRRKTFRRIRKDSRARECFKKARELGL